MSVSRYLQSYAEPEIALAEGIRQYHSLNQSAAYQHVLAIPAFNEPLTLVTRLANLPTTASVLVILVVNAPDKVDIEPALGNTHVLLKSLKQAFSSLSQLHSRANLLSLNSEHTQHLLMIERCHPGEYIPYQQGVGLARKIACDLACQLINDGRVACPWIHSTDADVELPEAYFTAVKPLDSALIAAATYPFRHTQNTALGGAQHLYSLSLDYYVEGLHWANSPYAFHTVGSTLVINYQHYAKCRGFPKRAAGEDFYLLNKMAKTGDIHSLSAPTLMIDCRESDRVPFGTGPAISKILQLSKARDNYLFYHPDCFYYLQQCLLLLPKLWPVLDKTQPLNQQILLANLDTLKIKNIDTKLLTRCLFSLGIDSAVGHALKQSKTQQAFNKHITTWFDAFKTLKFIHYLRAAELPSMNASDVVKHGPFISTELKTGFLKQES